jgi:prepilin-type processing-associated H-X9-DG protein
MSLYTSPITMVARSDYAVNGGEKYCDAFSLGLADAGPASIADSESAAWINGFVKLGKRCTGLGHPGSAVPLRQIEDGLSKTYLIGEKYLNPDFYTNGGSGGDNESMYMGSNGDIARWTTDYNSDQAPPLADTAGFESYANWGSAHPSIFNMVFCDGSVHSISFEINQTLNAQLSNRKDGGSINVSNIP